MEAIKVAASPEPSPPSWHVSPLYPVAHSQTSGSVHLPPFWQAGRQVGIHPVCPVPVYPLGQAVHEKDPTVLPQVVKASQTAGTKAHSSTSTSQTNPEYPVPLQLQVSGATQAPEFKHGEVQLKVQSVYPDP